jgi:hypothetical protein
LIAITLWTGGEVPNYRLLIVDTLEELETQSARNRDHALAIFGHEIGVKLALQGTAAPGYMLDEWEQTGTEARWGPYYAIDVFAVSD